MTSGSLMRNNLNIVKQCPACDTSNYSKVLTASDCLVSGELFDIMECNDCSLRFTSPIPNEEDIGNYYESDDYVSHTGKGNSIINKIYRFIQYFTLRSKKKIVYKNSNRRSGLILDIGCGTGDFLKIMKQSGWEVNGVEMNNSARQLAEINTNSAIMNQDRFFKHELKYDVITLWHSLEHLHELEQYLDKICTALKANGIIIIAVPNYKSFDAEYFKQNWAAYDVPRHLYHFSSEAMMKLMKIFNFELMQSKQLPFDPFYVSLLSEFSIRKKHNIIKALWIGWRSYCQGRKDVERGSSVLYIFKAKS